MSIALVVFGQRATRWVKWSEVVLNMCQTRMWTPDGRRWGGMHIKITRNKNLRRKKTKQAPTIFETHFFALGIPPSRGLGAISMLCCARVCVCVDCAVGVCENCNHWLPFQSRIFQRCEGFVRHSCVLVCVCVCDGVRLDPTWVVGIRPVLTSDMTWCLPLSSSPAGWLLSFLFNSFLLSIVFFFGPPASSSHKRCWCWCWSCVACGVKLPV